MNQDLLLRKIRQQAKRDERNRTDPRFLETLGFLVAKGFLKTNLDIPLLPNKRLRIEDVIWAGRNVEPRILEVLPAAVLRLTNHFDFDELKHRELATVLEELRKNKVDGPPFFEMPYRKLRTWLELPLADRRIKPLDQKRITKTYRLRPVVIAEIKRLAKEWNCTETEAIEKRLLADQE